MTTSRRVPELDAIRGIAVLSVLIFHFSIGAPQGVLSTIATFGWVGVELFFVLSGYLITGVLVEAKEYTRYFRDFYAKRALRIFPVYFTALAFTFWVALPWARHAGVPPGWAAIPSSEQTWYWLFLSNWRSAFGFYIGEPLGHYWSLAIEEQFYLVWPLIVFWCSSRTLLRVASMMAIASAALRAVLLLADVHAAEGQFLYRLTPTHLDGLAVGACVCLLLRDEAWRARTARFANGVLLLTGAAAATVLYWARDTTIENRVTAAAGYAVFSWGFGALLLRTVLLAGSGDVVCRFLRVGLLRSFGKYSYAIYVLHPLFAYWVRFAAKALMPEGDWWPMFAIPTGIGISYVAGLVSWHLFEKHFARKRREVVALVRLENDPVPAH